MALTRIQIISCGFKPGKQKKLGWGKKFDVLIFPLNSTDYLYLGKNESSVWVCFTDPETKERINYEAVKIGETGLKEFKEFIERTLLNFKDKP